MNSYQPSLLRGEGISEDKRTLYDRGFKRCTQQSLKRKHDAGEPVIIMLGAHAHFSMIWCFIRHPKIAFDETKMIQFVKLMLANTTDEMREHYPENGLTGMRVLFGLTSLLEDRAHVLWDISRNGNIFCHAPVCAKYVS